MISKTTFKRTSLFGSAALPALVLLGAGMFAAPAMAQDTTTTLPSSQSDQDANAGDIVVTGSLFRRTDTETASPVSVLSAETLQQRGLNTVAEAVQRISAGGAGNITQGWNTGSNFATGANAVSLRGLTVQSTLTIFDGLRMAPYPLADDGHRNFVDLNTIPNAIIERIEVLRDGASSTYGADAVAGVINVITKKQVTGLHLNGSAGVSDRGDAAEQRFDATWGYGDLNENGFNFYVNGEYQRQDALWARDRQYPFNTSNLHNICNSDGLCLNDGTQNAVYTNNLGRVTFNGLFATPVPTVRAVDDAGAIVPGADGIFHLLNAAAGCRDLTPVTVPVTTPTSVYTGTVQCQRDSRALYSQLQPEQERLGFSGRFTAKIGDRNEFYAAATYYQVRTNTQGAPSALNGNLPPPNPAGFLQPSNLYLPVYVCGTGVGSRLMNNTGCDATNGVLNPQNPYAANGQRAQILATYDQPRLIQTKARSLRGAIGLNGSFGSDWNYSVEASASQVQLDVNQVNYIIPQRLWNMVAQGKYNFMDPSANTQDVRDYVSPLNSTRSNSDLWQVSATLAKDLFQLPGGPLQTAVGVAYRHESIDNPSANPANSASPYDRYLVANAVGAVGSRNVKSAFYEISAPIIDQIELSASGRYDDYSSGQTNFSPKFGAKFKPINQLMIRGTWSKGFRIPSFNESYGLPTTGYVQFTAQCGTDAAPGRDAAFCRAHSPDGTIDNANTYARNSTSVGLTSVGNPGLNPEKSTSWTVGTVFEPIRNLSFTVDYFHIKVTDLIGGADYSPVYAQYYTNNGNVSTPGISGVLPGTPDIAFPNAMPHIGFIQYSFQNNDWQEVSGLDFGINLNKRLFGNVKWISSAEASYTIKFAKSIGGNIQRYDGTLSPCDVTSCSGSPKWRGSWQNSFEIGDLTLTATAYYTSGYDLASVDYDGVKGDCANNLGISVVAYPNTDVPVKCVADDTWNVDFSASYKIGDRFTVFANVLNILGIDPPFEPSAAYSIFQYNPSWAGANIIGRYFRVGAKVDF